MVDKYIQALSDGKIVSVDWHTIQEMLGEDENRLHACSICENGDVFPPNAVETTELNESQICEILSKARVGFMAETYTGNSPLMSIKMRFFSNAKPTTGPWMAGPA